VHRFQVHRTCVALASLLILVGCEKGERPKQLPGALTKPIDSYTGDEFYDLVQKLKYVGGHERERKCKDDPACEGPGGKKTRVLVDAVATQDSIGPATVPPFGVVYVRALNKGDAVEARYSLQPDKKLEYYMIITADSAGRMAWRMEQLDTKSKPMQHASAGSGAFVSCNHTWVAGAQADFKSCKNSAAAHDSVLKLGLMLQGSIDDQIWTACLGGCCVADP
jgi:hypothetical protein